MKSREDGKGSVVDGGKEEGRVGRSGRLVDGWMAGSGVDQEALLCTGVRGVRLRMDGKAGGERAKDK